jgi:hypothetical protein
MTRPPPKAENKVGPNLAFKDVKFINDAALKGSFIIFIAGDGGIPTQFTFHHPSGETALGAASWVCTPTADVKYLLENRSSSELAAWSRRKDAAIRAHVLAARTGRSIDADGVESWTNVDVGTPACKVGIQTYQALAKGAGKPDSAWLEYAPVRVQEAERAFKRAIAAGTAATANFTEAKPQYETRGGPAGTIPQAAVPYLEGYSYGAAIGLVKRRILGLADGSNLSWAAEVALEEENIGT